MHRSEPNAAVLTLTCPLYSPSPTISGSTSRSIGFDVLSARSADVRPGTHLAPSWRPGSSDRVLRPVPGRQRTAVGRPQGFVQIVHTDSYSFGAPLLRNLLLS